MVVPQIVVEQPRLSPPEASICGVTELFFDGVGGDDGTLARREGLTGSITLGCDCLFDDSIGALRAVVGLEGVYRYAADSKGSRFDLSVSMGDESDLVASIVAVVSGCWAYENRAGDIDDVASTICVSRCANAIPAIESSDVVHAADA